MKLVDDTVQELHDAVRAVERAQRSGDEEEKAEALERWEKAKRENDEKVRAILEESRSRVQPSKPKATTKQAKSALRKAYKEECDLYKKLVSEVESSRSRKKLYREALK